MSNLIKQLYENIVDKHFETQTLQCNYPDNYYGDQVCRVISNDKMSQVAFKPVTKN
ncbi:hypothetical protein [Thalassotalea ganghwensis]